MVIGRFRGGVGAVIWSPTREAYLLLKRSPAKDFAPGIWECVTGRVDQGEGFEIAVRREVREELGVEVDIDFILGTTHFYRGDETPENELVGVVYHCTLRSEAAITLSAEHSEARWMTVETALARLRDDHVSEAWLKRVLARAETLRSLLPPALIEINREAGFELDV